jgi:hypothetical protein
MRIPSVIKLDNNKTFYWSEHQKIMRQKRHGPMHNTQMAGPKRMATAREERIN